MFDGERTQRVPFKARLLESSDTRTRHISIFLTISHSPAPDLPHSHQHQSFSLERLTVKNKKYSKIHLAGLQIQKCTEQ